MRKGKEKGMKRMMLIKKNTMREKEETRESQGIRAGRQKEGHTRKRERAVHGTPAQQARKGRLRPAYPSRGKRLIPIGVTICDSSSDQKDKE